MTLASSRQNRTKNTGKSGHLLPHGLEHVGEMGHLEKQISDQGSARETGTEAARTPSKAITPFSTPRVARPQTDPPATSSDKRQRLKLGRRPRESAPRPPSSGAPSRTQQRAGRTRKLSQLAGPGLARPPPPTSAARENSERLPYQEQEAEDAPADHQLGRRRRHLRFRF